MRAAVFQPVTWWKRQLPSQSLTRKTCNYKKRIFISIDIVFQSFFVFVALAKVGFYKLICSYGPMAAEDFVQVLAYSRDRR
jgi:hypothetical protein